MKKSNQNWSEVKSAIKDFPNNALLDIIADLYRLSKDNQQFIHTRYLSANDTLESYKEIIRKAFPVIKTGNERISLASGRKAIGNFKKASGAKELLLDLMIYYVECGTQFTLDYGDIDEPFYNSLGSMFYDVVELLKKEQNEYLTSSFLPRLQKLVQEAYNNIGWGYGDEIKQYYNDLIKWHGRDV